MKLSIALFFVLSLTANAQELPNASHFWTKQHIVLSVADGAAKAVDFRLTERNWSLPNHRETNSFYRPFMHRSHVEFGAFMVGLWASDQLESYAIHRVTRNHPHWRWLQSVPVSYGIMANTSGAHYSAVHYKEQR